MQELQQTLPHLVVQRLTCDGHQIREKNSRRPFSANPLLFPCWCYPSLQKSINHELPIRNGVFAVRNVALDLQIQKGIANGWEIVNDKKSFIVFGETQHEKMIWYAALWCLSNFFYKLNPPACRYKAMQAAMEECGATIDALANTAATWKSDKEVQTHSVLLMCFDPIIIPACRYWLALSALVSSR